MYYGRTNGHRAVYLFYGRVSKKEQARDSSAAERQEWLLRKTAQDMGVSDPQLFFDVQSGRKDDRPDFQKVLRLIESRQAKRLVIPRADRITRKIETNAQLVELFEKTGVELWEIYRGGLIDFANPSDWEYFTHAGVSSEAESRRNSKRIRDGQEFARFRRKPNARSPFGFCKTADRSAYMQDERPWKDTGMTTAEVARACFDLFVGSPEQPGIRQFRTIIPLLEQRYQVQFTATGFNRWLRNEVLRGHTPYQRQSLSLEAGVRIEYNTHKGLITEAEYQELLVIMRRNKRLRGKNKKGHIYPLSGLLFCGQCGQRMSLSRSPSGAVYAYCNNRTRQGKQVGYRNGVPLPEAEQLVVAALTGRAEAIAAEVILEQGQAPENPEILRLRERIARLDGLIREMGDDAGNLRKEIYRLEAELQQRQGGGFPQEADAGLRRLMLECGSLPEFWLQLTPERKETFYQWFVRRVVCLPNASGWHVDHVELSV